MTHTTGRSSCDFYTYLGSTHRLACVRAAGLMVVMLLGFAGCESAPETSRTVTAELEIDPQQAQAFYEQGLAAIQDEDLELAESLFAQAVASDDRHGPAYNNLGKIQYLTGSYQDAALSFRAAAEQMPFRAEPVNNLGLVMEVGNRYDDAVEHFEKAVKLEPGDHEYLGNFVRARIRRGDDDAEVRRQLAQIVRDDPREGWVDWARSTLVRLESDG